MFFDIYLQLCRERRISPTAAALEMGIGRSTVSTWKNEGRTPTGATLQKVSDYFGVTTDYLLGTSKEKSPTAKSGEVSDDDIKFALFDGGPITDAQFEEVKRFAQYVKERDARDDK